jgi:hypothetical protein
MRLLKSLAMALVLAFSVPVTHAADEAEKHAEKIEVSALPAAVKDGFTKEVAGGEIISAKKLGGDKVRYQLKYKLDGKEHQITLDEAGMPTRKKKKDGEEK